MSNDSMMLAAEARDLGFKRVDEWTLPDPPSHIVINPWNPKQAETNFLKAFNDLYIPKNKE